MKKILLSTHNPAKIQELKLGLSPLQKINFDLLTLNDLNIIQEPEETGKTFKENAILKARYYSRLTNLPTIADDGGLIIPYLNNDPGVKSNRWLGYKAGDQELINYTLERLQGTTKKQRKAYLETCLCFFLPEQYQVHPSGVSETEKIAGHLAEKPYKNYLKGFPYRALLIVDKYNKYYDELTLSEHQQINHRLKALKRIVPKIKDLIK